MGNAPFMNDEAEPLSPLLEIKSDEDLDEQQFEFDDEKKRKELTKE